MKNKIIAVAVSAVLLGSALPSFAQSYDRGGPPQGNYDRGGPPGRDGRDGRGPGGPGDRRDDRRDDHRFDQRGDNRGAGPNHDFRRGGRLPPEYRNRQYVVNNWREHRLNAPPRGYQWVQTGGDYVLAAIATGIIAQILINR